MQEPHRNLPLEELARSSAVAGVAEVVRIDVRRDPETGAIYTDAHLRMRETWSPACPPAPVLTQVGGELDGLRSAIPGRNWTLAPGETVVVFAKPWKGPYVAAAGMRQGVGHVDARGRVTWDVDRGASDPPPAPALDEVRVRVGKALGRELAPPNTERETAPPPAPVESVPTPGRMPTPSERTDPGRGGLPFFAVAALLALVALALRLRKKAIK